MENEPADSGAGGISIGFRFRPRTLFKFGNFHTKFFRVQWPIVPKSETLLIIKKYINI